MCVIILRPNNKRKKKHLVFRKVNYWLAVGNKWYANIFLRVINRPRRVMVTFGMVLVLIFVLHRFIPTGFIPQEDQGYSQLNWKCPKVQHLNVSEQ
jgi:multidrug efflux pump subunit AcrB